MKEGVDRDNWSGPVHVNPAAPAGVEPGTRKRIASQRDVIFTVVSDGRWRTLRELEEITGYPQASISARLRDFRKEDFGEYTVESMYRGNGIYAYRVTP